MPPTLLRRAFKLQEDFMMNTPKRTLLAGLLLGALVIGASVMRSGEEKRTHDDGASSSGELDSGPVDALKSNSASVREHSDEVARILQAVRDSLKRNDLASAKVLLGAVQTLHKDDSQALTLQKELQAREGTGETVFPATTPDNPPDSLKATRSAERVSSKAERSHDSTRPVREHAIRASRHSRITSVPQVKVPSNSDVSSEALSPAADIGRADSTLSEATPPVASAPLRPALTPATPASAEALPPVRPVEPTRAPVQSNQAPKTREEVRAELYRARADGMLPRFGNPDPAGPGGVPSSTKTEFGSE